MYHISLVSTALSSTHSMDMSHQEIYFRTLVVLLGLAIAAGGIILEGIIILKVIEALGGIALIVITTIKRFKLWP